MTNQSAPLSDTNAPAIDPVRTRREQLAHFGQDLLEATESLTPIAPLRNRLEGMTLADAYHVQTVQLDHHTAGGRVLAGRKVGLTSLAMQKQLGVDSPDFGFFFEDMVYGDGANIPASAFIQPKVEPEFGFVLKEKLQGPGVTVEQAAAAIDAIYPAIEIIDSRITDWDIKLVDTVADNASCGAIAVGAKPLDLDPSALLDTLCSLVIDGVVTGSGNGADVMGNPVAPLAWLANVLADEGVALEAGQLILPGSFTKAEPVTAGSTAVADFGPLGSLTIHFTD
ncbi:fumarylacetoacetate hydrolase family protein [Pseudarthrobacter sp. lyk4-40-TYG-27]|uniref:2-keto-4-pentenoate hydratase n=1 Tax=Pseudarthrobacter sp. lyk4-40-TYG-27 TaxID=3040305 RepID=UPI0025569A9F|nr:fumarylacetoacetate hydrolase family protein [Pseudarthrobacter sp. lyk4-40-TYG-27]